MLRELDFHAFSTEEDFYSRAYFRIVRFMVVTGVVVCPALWIRFDYKVGLGFLAGCLVSAVNFYWLNRIVSALGEQATSQRGGEILAGFVARFLLRYLLIGMVAYVIFTSPAINVFGFFAGLSLPVAGIFCEALLEGLMAIRRA